MTNPIDQEFEQIFCPPDRKVTKAERAGHALAILLAIALFVLLISGAVWATVKIWVSIASMM